MKVPGRKIRAAIYCRVSSEERLGQEFNSIQAQQKACEAYVASQRSQGRVLVPDTYIDAGISGGSLERPALQRLLRDLEHGAVQVIVTYKIDRLSRSISDFVKLVELFDQHGATFISVTQSFATTTAIGRMLIVRCGGAALQSKARLGRLQRVGPAPSQGQPRQITW